ncbi:MAG TPA: hypothetical protein VFM14_16005 [Gemmatimonadales bacterium]|nr:hypothetical protein [Gemmatimonadales bacterium]
MNHSRSWLRLCFAGALVATGTAQAAAQVGTVSNAQVISLAAAKSSQLSVAVTAGATQTLPSFTDNTTNNFPSPVVIRTQWDLHPGQTGSVRLIAWFATPAQALFNAGSGTAIASSRMRGRVATGVPVTFAAFTQNPVGGVGAAGGSLQLLNVNINGANKTTTRSDNLQLQLDLTGAGVLPPGTYSGTLNIQAVTQ